MASQHWFDRLHRTLADDVPRRGFIHAAGALVAALLQGTATPTVAAKGKNKKGKGKHKPKHPKSCSHGACAAEWPDDKANRDYCEFICRQCDGNDPREFCIVEGDPEDPAKVATCCIEGAICCGAQCCGDRKIPGLKCCSGHCTNTSSDRKNCGQCGHSCPTNTPCIDGQCACPDGKTLCIDGCVDTESDPRNCRHCGEECPDEWECCEGTCYDTDFSTTNCGGCGLPCPFGEGLPSSCCNGVCTDIVTDPENCGRCGHQCDSDQLCCGGFCYDPSQLTCCPNNWKACGSPYVCCQDADGNWDCCLQ
jgi:hypothetical protein